MYTRISTSRNVLASTVSTSIPHNVRQRAEGVLEPFINNSFFFNAFFSTKVHISPGHDT